MGRLFEEREDIMQAKSFYLKICDIWKRYVLETLYDSEELDKHTELLIDEAWK